MVRKLIKFFFVFVLSVSFAAGFAFYTNQTKLNMDQCVNRLHGQTNYLADLMKVDGKEFIAYQKISLEVGDKVRIPYDFDGNYHLAEKTFYDKFNNENPGKTLGVDMDYNDMSEELKVLFVTYKQEFWLNVFEKCNENFGVLYTYYVAPTQDGEYMYYIIDLARYYDTDENGNYFILLNECIELDKEENAALWETWEKGEQINKLDAYNNELGKTYAGYTPLWIDGQKMGVVIAEMEIDDISRQILDSSIRQSLRMMFLTTFIAMFITIAIGKRYIARLIKLKGEVVEYTEKKDPAIAVRITEDIRGNDEIADLAVQVAAMIDEIGAYMKTLIDKNKELTEAQMEIRVANELANKDSLTGIRNKTSYDTEIKKYEAKMEAGESNFGIAIVDLNFLKKINDTYGHEKGNLAIQKLCRVVCNLFHHSPVFRIGGDEFAIILHGMDYDNYDQIYARYIELMKETENNDSLEPWEKISASIGAAFCDLSVDTCVEDVFKRADANMYEHKKEMKAMREN